MTSRITLIAVVALAAGLAVGSLITHARLQSQWKEERDSASRELARLAEDRDKAAKRAGTLEERNRRLEEEARALQDEVEAIQARPDVAPVVPQATLAEDVVSTPETTDASAAPDDRPRRRGRGPFDREDEQLTEEERAERVERWQAFREEQRAERDALFQAQLDKAPDRATRERLQSIQEYGDYMRQLWESMRDAETDEERESIRQSLEETGQVLRDLRQEQQNQIVRDLASEYGITDKNKQDAFLNAVRNLESNPFFQDFPRGGGFGRGPGGRGPMGGGFPGQ